MSARATDEGARVLGARKEADRKDKTGSHKAGKATHMLGANTVRFAKQLWLGG